MNKEKTARKDLYYTPEHEWIDFQGAVAYIGVCAFKLSGFREIDQVSFTATSGFKKQGAVIATIKYSDYHIQVCMPVDGKLQEVNEQLAAGRQHLLLQQAEGSCWIARIIPARPYERTGLMLPKEYQLNGKGKHAK